MLGFIIRSTKSFKKPRSILCLFFSLVRSILEYCCPIWSPYYDIHVANIEKIQKRCLKYISHKYNFGRALKNYGERLGRFELISLESRRRRYDLLCLHKIMHAAIDAPELLSSLNLNTRYRSRSPNTFSMQVYKNNTSYFNPIVRMCRTYNQVVLSGESIDVFNARFPAYKGTVSDIIRTNKLK
jgi:hypothetical protein